MQRIFLTLFNMSVTAGYLVCAAVLLRFALKKAPKWIMMIVWAMVAVRLVIPFSVESPVSIIPSAETVTVSEISGRDDGAKLVVHSGISVIDAALAPAAADRAPAEKTDFGTSDLLGAASVVWLCVASCILLYGAVSFAALKIKLRQSVPVGDGVYVCDAVGTPFVLGLFRPRVYVPSGTDERTLRHVVAHEKAHIRRMDHLWKPLGFAITAVYWFNPAIWVAYVLLCRDIELACDESVIKKYGKDGLAEYSQALLDTSIRRRLVAVCPLAFGANGVKRRVKNVLNYKRPAFWIIIIALAACAVTAALLLTDPLKKPDGGEKDAAPVTDGTENVDGTDELQEYTGLDASHGLEVYVNKLESGKYVCRLAPDSGCAALMTDAPTDAVGIETMRDILAGCDVPDGKVYVVVGAAPSCASVDAIDVREVHALFERRYNVIGLTDGNCIHFREKTGDTFDCVPRIAEMYSRFCKPYDIDRAGATVTLRGNAVRHATNLMITPLHGGDPEADGWNLLSDPSISAGRVADEQAQKDVLMDVSWWYEKYREENVWAYFTALFEDSGVDYVYYRVAYAR